jgi:hypothetical protein
VIRHGLLHWVTPGIGELLVCTPYCRLEDLRPNVVSIALRSAPSREDKVVGLAMSRPRLAGLQFVEQVRGEVDPPAAGVGLPVLDVQDAAGEID